MAGNARSISAIVVPLKTDVTPFTKGLSSASKQGKDFASKQNGILGKLEIHAPGLAKFVSGLTSATKSAALLAGGVAAIGTAAGAAAIAFGRGGFDRIRAIGEEAADLNTTAETLGRLRNVARDTGTSFKDLSVFVGTLSGRITESIGHTELQRDSFRKLGTSAEELAKLPLADQIRVLNRGFAQLPSDAEKSRVAFALAGQEGLKNFRLLTVGVNDFDKSFASGIVQTDEDVSEIRKLQIVLDKIYDRFEKLVDLVTLKFVPAITSVAESVHKLANPLAGFFGGGKAAPAPAALVPNPVKAAGPAAPAAPDPKILAAQADQARRQQAAAQAQAKVVELQAIADKQAKAMRDRPNFNRSTNGGKLVSSNQKLIQQYQETQQKLARAQQQAQRAFDDALSPEAARSQAARIAALNKPFLDLLQENREAIQSAGKDEIVRRVDSIKGLTPAQRKTAIASGYQAREADRTSALTDELVESTKTPFQKLQENISRIERGAQLGKANGGLSQVEAIRGLAQKAQESGLTGSTKYAGALQANSIEGRSALLEQFGRQNDDPVAVARQVLAATNRGNSFLAKIAGEAGRTNVVQY